MYPDFIIKENELPRKIRAGLPQMDIEEKIHAITRWLTSRSRSKPRYMLFMIMYDIENNRIRTHIAKYLIRKGCMRIQKSVYIIKGTKSEVRQITNTLKEVNEAYNNHDSIFVLPVPQEKFLNMKVIGKNITFEVVIESKNVLVF